MRCEDFLKLLDGDGAAPTPEAAAHAESCLSCGAALARWNAARRELRALADEPAPPFLSARVMAAVRAEVAGRQRPAAAVARWRLHLLPALALLVTASLGAWALRLALRGGAPVQEARAVTAAADNGRRDVAPPALADRAAQAPAGALEKQAPAPAAPRRRAALKAERSEQSSAVPAQAPGFAPEPAAAPVGESDARIEPPRLAGGAVGGVLAAAPAAARSAPAAAKNATAGRDAGLEKGAAVGLDEIKARTGGAVTVRLTAADGATVLDGSVDAGAAPPPGTWWRVRVNGEGGLALLDADGRDIGSEHPDTLAFLHARRLSSGEYRLSR